MENDSPFRMGGSTYAIASAASAPIGIQIGGPAAGDVSILVFNSGTVVSFLGYATSASQAQNNAVAPVPGTPQPVLTCPPGALAAFTVPPGQFFSATSASAVTVYITPGNGN